MSRYEGHEHVRGATPEEAAIFQGIKALTVFKGASISKYLYTRYLSGNRVPLFVRERLSDFLLAKGKELEKLAKSIKKN